MGIALDFTPNGAQDATVPGSVTGVSRVGSGGTIKYDGTFPIQPPTSARVIVAAYGGLKFDFAAQDPFGARLTFTAPDLPPADGFQFLAVWGAAGTRHGDLSMDDAGHVRLRDGNAVVDTSTSLTLTPGMVCTVFVKCDPGSETGHRARWYVGTNCYGSAADYDTGDKTATRPAVQTGSTKATTVTSVQVGQVPLGTNAVDMLVGRTRVSDDGTDPGSGYGSTAPAAPTVTATGGDGQIVLAWTPPTGQTGCLVWRSTSMPGPYALLAAQPADGAGTFTDSTVTNDTAYYYCVRVKTTDWSPRSPRAHATPTSGGGGGGGGGGGSSSAAYALSDLETSGCTLGGGGDGALATAIDETDGPSDSDYVEITPGSAYAALAGPPPTLPFASDAEVKFSYRLAPGNTAPVVAKLMLGSVELAVADRKTSPGTYSLVLSAAQRAQITNSNKAGLAFRFESVDTAAGAGDPL